MGADIHLPSICDPNDDNSFRLPEGAAVDPAKSMQTFFDQMTATGGYFRNGYNSGDIMWTVGLSWHGDVMPMLDAEQRLPVERAHELVALLEANPMTDERLAAVYLEKLTNGVDVGTAAMLDRAIGDNRPKAPPDYAQWAGFVRKKREQLLALLRKSIDLNEPLWCSL